MPGLDVPNFDIGINKPTGGGLLSGLDPDYQLAQAKLALVRQQLKQGQAFSSGVPTLQDGSPDYDAIAKTQIQNGDVGGGVGLLANALKLRLLQAPADIDDPTAQGIGQGRGAAPGGLLAALAPAAGGGMIATEAGGDSYGRQAGAGYAGVGQVGIGGQGATAIPAGAAAGGAASSTATAGAGGDPLDIYAHSIGSLESGNRYDVKGVVTKSGDRAYGRFQVMGSNIPSWTKEVLGKAMSADDFLANPQAQDAVFRAKFGQSVDKYGNPMDAASVWFSGKPIARAGNAADALGTTVPAYIQKFAAGLGPAARAVRGAQGGAGQPEAPGQAAASTAALAGGQAQPISFEGADASSSPGAGGAAPSDAPVTDSQVNQARKLITVTENYDPASLSPAAQRAVTAAQDTVTRYTTQQAQPAAAGMASPGTLDGVPAQTQDTPPTGIHPLLKGTPTPQGGPGLPRVTTSTPTPGAGLASQGGGAQPISFGGGAPALQGAPAQPATAPALAPANGPPPETAAALARLRNGQGNAADLALWGSYQRSAGQGGASAGAAPAAPTGPDLPSLPQGYREPGGGARYVTDVQNRAGRFVEGDPRIAIWQNRAKQVQEQLDAAQKFRNDMTLAQARADDRYAAANSPGAIAAAGAKAGAEATERNRLSLVPSVQADGSTIMIPQSDALASAQAGKPIVSAQPGYVTTGQGNLLAKLNDGSKAYQERQVASQRLDAMSSLLENYQTGANSTAFNEAAANLRSMGITVPNSATLNPGAMQEFAKDTYANVLSSTREQGNKQYAAEVQSAINSNPNPDLQPEANAAMIAQMQGTKRWYDQNYRDYSQWYHGNKGAADDADFQTSWADKHPLGAYVSAAGKDIAPIGLPQPSADKLVDGQAYQTAKGKARWSASAGRMVPFGGPTAPALGAGDGGRGRGGSATAPAPGARQAPDGNWYVPDPSRQGKFLQVTR